MRDAVPGTLTISHRTGNAGSPADRRHIQEAETAGRRPKAGRGTGKGRYRLRAEPEICGEVYCPD